MGRGRNPTRTLPHLSTWQQRRNQECPSGLNPLQKSNRKPARNRSCGTNRQSKRRRGVRGDSDWFAYVLFTHGRPTCEETDSDGEPATVGEPDPAEAQGAERAQGAAQARVGGRPAGGRLAADNPVVLDPVDPGSAVR